MKHTCGTETVESHTGGTSFQYCRACKVEVSPTIVRQLLDFPDKPRGLAAWLPLAGTTAIAYGINRLTVEEEIYQQAALHKRDSNTEHNVVFISDKNYLDLYKSLGERAVFSSLAHISGGKVIKLAGPYGYLQIIPSSLLNDDQYCFSTVKETS